VRAGEELAKLFGRRPRRARAMLGKVTSTSPLTVQPRGSAGTIGPLRLIRSMPSVGDQVALLRHGETWLVLGKDKLPIGICGLELVDHLGVYQSVRDDVFIALPTLSSDVSVDVTHDFFVTMGDATDLQLGVTDVDGHQYGQYLFGIGESVITVGASFPGDPDDHFTFGASGVFPPPNPPDGSLRPYPSTHDRLGLLLTPPGENQQAAVDIFNPESFNVDYDINTDTPGGLFPGEWKVTADMHLDMGSNPPQEGFLDGTIRVTTWRQPAPDPIFTFNVPEGLLKFTVRLDHPHIQDLDDQGELGGRDVVWLDLFYPDGLGPYPFWDNPYLHLFFLWESPHVLTILPQSGAETEDGYLLPGVWTLRLKPRRLRYPSQLGVSAYCVGTGPPGSIHQVSQRQATTGAEGSIMEVIPFTIPDDLVDGAEEIGFRFHSSTPVGNAIARVRLFRPGLWEANPTESNTNSFSTKTDLGLDETLMRDWNMDNYHVTFRNNAIAGYAAPTGLHHLVLYRFGSTGSGPDRTLAGTYTMDLYYRPWAIP
jgi:hypothetical protein